jgi:phage shock protein PspC (stress-responsive transcriptional regulator)
MNKTISVNIGGRVFNIEEDAYEKLNRYLRTIRGYFTANESADEIISDIELRIAELFQERTSPLKQAITPKDVDEVIAIMGQPEDYAEEGAAEEASSYRASGTRSKRVFRDPDNKVLFGTCSGISAYFGWDPIVLRAIFAVLFVFFGSGLLVYLILTIIIPKAQTTAEKLEMRGEPVTVENISKKVSESFEDVKQDIKDFGKKNNINEGTFQGFSRQVGDFARTLGSFIVRILTLIITLIGKILGLALFIAGICGILFLISALFGWEMAFKYSSNGLYIEDQLRLLVDASFANTTLQTLGIVGTSLLVAIPIIGMLILGIRLLFDYRKIPGYVGVVMITLWFVGLGLVVSVGARLAQDFRIETAFTEPVDLYFPDSDTLYIDVSGNHNAKYKFKSGFGDGSFFYSGHVTFPGLDSTDIVYMGKNRFTIAKNEVDTVYRLQLNRSANGHDQKDAIENASGTRSEISLSGDSLMVHPYFAILKGQKLRNQGISYTLLVPVGKSVHFNEGSRKVIYDVPNVTNTRDSQMLGKTWTMTQNGLVCTSHDMRPEESEDESTDQNTTQDTSF